MIRNRSRAMPANRQRTKLKMFHATMRVTRTEQWWVEAKTADEARAILAAGEGHHCALGELVDVELEQMLEAEG
jgi:hypothetical protein